MTSGVNINPVKWCRALVDTPRKRHWMRVGLCLILVVGPGLYGWLSWPGTQEAPDLVGPKIVILADQQVAATVNMVLTVYPGHAVPSSELQLVIVPTSNISGSAMLIVELDDFPMGTRDLSNPSQLSRISPPAANSVSTSPLQAAPPPAKNYSDYVITGQALAQQGKAKITIVTEDKAVGEDVSGAQLRVTFPALIGETPGANPSATLPLQELYSGGLASQATTTDVHPLALQAGTAAFTFQGTPLSDYQFLAGDSPIPLGSQWFWDGINDVTALAANITTQDADQQQVFESGVAFGVAAGALISFFLELIPADALKPAEPAEEVTRHQDPLLRTPRVPSVLVGHGPDAGDEHLDAEPVVQVGIAVRHRRGAFDQPRVPGRRQHGEEDLGASLMLGELILR
jgi:hypothetical protein